MQLVLMRHGQTKGNAEKRYLGRTEEPLNGEGIAAAQAAGIHPEVAKVYVSPLGRARQTAEVCFPNAEQAVDEELTEIDFGRFEGKRQDDLLGDSDYQTWLDARGAGRIPEGESRHEHITRTCRALSRIITQTREAGEDRVIVVAHAGTVMAAMHVLCPVQKRYFEWRVANCQGYKAKVDFVEEGEWPVRLLKPRLFDNLDFLYEKHG